MKILTIAALLVLTAPIFALGQDAPDFEIGAGYSLAFLRRDYDWATYPGWRVEAARRVAPYWAFAGIVQCNYYSLVDDRFGDSESHRTYTFLAGVKTAANRRRRVMPLFQALAGVEHSSSTLRPIGVPPLDLSTNGFVVQGGTGVHVWVGSAVALEVGLDALMRGPWYGTSWLYPEWRAGVSVVYVR